MILFLYCYCFINLYCIKYNNSYDEVNVSCKYIKKYNVYILYYHFVLRRSYVNFITSDHNYETLCRYYFFIQTFMSAHISILIKWSEVIYIKIYKNELCLNL